MTFWRPASLLEWLFALFQKSAVQPYPDDWAGYLPEVTNLEELTSDELARVEESAQWAAKILQPSVLLINMHGPYRRSQKATHFSGIAGGYDEGGKPNPDVRIFPHIVTYLNADPDFVHLRKRLMAAKVQVRFIIQSERDTSLEIFVPITSASLAGIKTLAKEDAGISTAQEFEDFDARFEVYLKQNWDPDWKKWRERLPLVSWP